MGRTGSGKDGDGHPEILGGQRVTVSDFAGWHVPAEVTYDARSIYERRGCDVWQLQS